MNAFFETTTNDLGINSLADRPKWLKARREGLGGSDMAAIMGLDPWRSALDVYRDKVAPREEEDEEEDGPAIWGHILEEPVIREFGRRTGRDTWQSGRLLQSKEYPLLFVTVDGEQLVGGAEATVEAKTTALGRFWGEKGRETNGEDIPIHVQVQLQHNLLVTRSELTSVAVLAWPERSFYFRDVYPHHEFQQLILEAGARFWSDHVLRGISPEPPSDEDRLQLWAQFNPVVSNSTLTIEGAEALELEALWEQYKELSAVAKRADEDRKLIAQEVAVRMGTYEKFLLPSGRAIKRGHIKETAFTCPHCQKETGRRNAYDQLYFLVAPKQRTKKGK